MVGVGTAHLTASVGTVTEEALRTEIDCSPELLNRVCDAEVRQPETVGQYGFVDGEDVRTSCRVYEYVAPVALFLNEPLAFNIAGDDVVAGDHDGVPAATFVGATALAGPAVRIVRAATAPTIPAVTQRRLYIPVRYHAITLSASGSVQQVTLGVRAASRS